MQQGGFNMEIMILPLLMILINLAITVFAIWFCISLIKSQRERNKVLKEISNKLDNPNFFKKEE